jgi:signal transduction histidine kinase/ActR/RegA family two-component response regulator
MTTTHVPEVHRGLTGLFVPRGRRLHPIVRLDYLVRVSTYPLYFILFAVTLYPDRYTTFFWVLLSFHLFAWPHLALAIASRARNQKLAEYTNLMIDSAIIGCYLPLAEFNLGPCAAALLGIFSGCISVGGWRMGVRSALAIAFGVVVAGAMYGVSFQPLGGSVLAQGLGVAVIFVYVTVFSYQSYGQAQRMVKVAKQMEAQSLDLQRNGALLEERTHQLELARDAAEAANSSKSQFLANMSHELRTPLNAIIGYSDLLIEEAEELEAQDLVPDLEKIRSSGKHLLGLINDVLDLSKIEAGKMEISLETFAVGEVVSAAVAMVRPLIEKNANTLRLAIDPDLGSMHADLTRVRQILLNLLSNASKFTEKGTITLVASRELDDGRHWIVFEVHDTGIGMTPAQRERLFQPFTQADPSTTRKYGGTGLGLSITKRFCELMNGTIGVTSEAGEGSVFTVRLPAEVQEKLHRQTGIYRISRPSVPMVAIATRTVLLIDQDTATRELVQRLITKDGLEMLYAATGQEGLRIATERKPDVILLDVMLPDQDGWAVLTAITTKLELASIPVVVVTAADERGLATTLGASAYLSKPVSQDELRAAIRGTQTSEMRTPTATGD